MIVIQQDTLLLDIVVKDIGIWQKFNKCNIRYSSTKEMWIYMHLISTKVQLLKKKGEGGRAKCNAAEMVN